ncbi:MAG: carbohydrate ABC transporter permease [Roseburia sp.]|nr:carbohydrate ABC transporter permease [Roseburia sp.]
MGKWSLEGYILLLKNGQMLSGLKNSVLLTVIGTLYSLILEIPVAYVTSKKEFGWLANFFYYLSLFGIALLPLYLLLKKMNLLNNLWGIILPGGMSVYYMQQLRARMLIQVAELEDAAFLDGCGPVRYLLQICIPVMGPTIGVIGFFHACGYWGNTLLAKTILTDESKFPLTLVLNQIMIQNQTSSVLGSTEAVTSITTLCMAEFGMCVISALPMVVLFMLIKRYIKPVENAGGFIM